MLDFIRGVVRPAVTLVLVAAGIAAVFTGRLEAEWLASAASMAVGFWFVDRTANRPME